VTGTSAGDGEETAEDGGFGTQLRGVENGYGADGTSVRTRHALKQDPFGRLVTIRAAR
jgi:hypothetical protein